jgi:hypothetical protein
VPTVTYLGPAYSTVLDGHEPRFRRVPFEVDIEWLNTWRARMDPKSWLIEGDEQAPTIEDVPDAGWKRTDILAWLSTNGIEPTGYTTKGRALELVGNYLSEGQNDKQVQVEESPVEEHPQGDDE